jgi:hypothetical protein
VDFTIENLLSQNYSLNRVDFRIENLTIFISHLVTLNGLKSVKVLWEWECILLWKIIKVLIHTYEYD